MEYIYCKDSEEFEYAKSVLLRAGYKGDFFLLLVKQVVKLVFKGDFIERCCPKAWTDLVCIR